MSKNGFGIDKLEWSMCTIVRYGYAKRTWNVHNIYISSSCRAASTDIPDLLSPLLPIIHRLRQVFRIISCVLT